MVQKDLHQLKTLLPTIQHAHTQKHPCPYLPPTSFYSSPWEFSSSHAESITADLQKWRKPSPKTVILHPLSSGKSCLNGWKLLSNYNCEYHGFKLGKGNYCHSLGKNCRWEEEYEFSLFLRFLYARIHRWILCF